MSAQAAPQTVSLAAGAHTLAVATTQAGATGTQYVFTGWSDGGAASHSILVTSSAANYTASFKTQYQLTTAASPAAGGTVTPASGTFYDAASVVNLTTTANSGYQFSNWSGPVSAAGSASTTVTMSAAETVTANFASLTGITVQTNPAGLQFTVDGGAAQTAPQTLNLVAGAHTLAVATTQPGLTGTQYVFTGWSDSGAASHSITVTGSAATYTATFKTQYQLTISASPAAGGTITPATGTFYDAGAVVPISATANTGYSFSSWTAGAASASTSSTTVTMSAALSITANFSSLTGITIQTSPPGLQFSVDGGSPQTAPSTLNLAQGAHTIAVVTTQPGTTGTQYLFTAWSDSGAASHSITVTTLAATYTASFKTQYQLTTAPAAGGTVTPATGAFYDAASVVNLTATANSGYQFSNWSGPVAAANSATTTVTMSAPETITANFVTLTAITIQTNPAGLQFTVDGGAAQSAPQTLSLTAGSHTLAVAATQAGAAGTQYVFSAWSDSGAASHTITVGAAAATYTASFTTQYQLTMAVSPAGSGTVTPSSGGFFAAGIPVAIGATAASGFTFQNWTSGAGGTVATATSASTTVALSAPTTLTANFQVATAGLRFVPVTPCRVLDTRGAAGLFGGPSIAGGTSRNFAIPQSACNIPSTAKAYSLNVTVAPPGPLTYLTIWPAGQTQPVVSTLNSLDGRIVANAAIVPAGTNGSISVYVSNTTDVIVDINGYFAPSGVPSGPTSLSFYSATPCRIVDTRGASGVFGGPFMSGGSTRSFAVPSSSCGIPGTAQAYSLNITVVPHAALQYLTTWPMGQPQPVVSTLNALDGNIVANAAIVPAGTSGAVSVFVTNDTDLIIDINGYFAPAGSAGALTLYTLAPCRVADTRGATGPFGGPSLTANGTRSFAIPSSGCGVPLTAQAYSLNLTVVPPGTLTYLTAWPAGQAQPVVSTLNSPAGKIVANAAIVPAGASSTSGAVSIFVSNTTDAILDINAYFGQ